MADDPNRDILPVKDDSCYGSVRCSSDIDPRERHVVCKLDRYELEDRYLRLLEEVQSLKKLSNNQEDKIKRLATKLMRAAASSRTCSALLTANEERERIAKLEIENTRLKEKAYTLKNQLVSHRGPRSPLRCRHVPSGVSSSPTTYRSESARTKYQPPPRDEIVDNDAQNYLVKIEELETERNEMMTRITDLESQITVHVAGIQREKVQENVEYIRMWRQMKQANDKLISLQAANETLHSQIGDLKKLLEETTKNNREVTAALVSEKQRFSELDEQVASAKDSQLSLREKDEQIRNLTNEMKILQQHNDELIALSSRFGKVEIENVELKRKLADSALENQNLKSELASEQASQTALRAANDKLMKKLEELQRNADVLTVQLVQNQGENRLVSKGSQTELKSVDKNVETSFVSNGPISLPSDEAEEIISDEGNNDDRLEVRRPKFRPDNQFSRGNKPEAKNPPRVQSRPQSRSSPRNNDRKSEGKMKLAHLPTSPSMSREKILKLLDQAQISTPLETQNAARMRQIDVAVAQNDASSEYPNSYRIPVKRTDEFALTDISPPPEFFDPKQVLLTVFEILKNYSEKLRGTMEVISSCEDDLESRSDDFISNRDRDCNSKRKIPERIAAAEVEDTKEPILLNRFTETECCLCDSNSECLATSDCGYGCCSPETNRGLIFFNRSSLPSKNDPAIGKRGATTVGEIGLTIREAFNSIYGGSDVTCGCNEECNPDFCSEIKTGMTSERQAMNVVVPKFSSRESERCKELLREHSNKLGSISYNKRKSDCNNEEDCNSDNECGDSPCTATFPLLITKGQGLIEIHIISLQLSAKATQTLLRDISEDVSVFISCQIWGQETAFTPIAKYPSLSFNSSSVYRVSELENFFDHILREEIIFKVHVVNRDQEAFTLAKSKLSVKDILDYPQNKLHYVTPVISILPCSCGENFGQLSLWIRLSCDLDLIENFKDRYGLPTAVTKLQETQLPVEQVKQEAESLEKMRKDSKFSSFATSGEIYSYPTDAARQEDRRNTFGSLTGNKSSRLDTISESVESVYQTNSGENLVKNGEYYSGDSDLDNKLRKEIDIRRYDFLTTSPAPMENYSRPDSETEMNGAVISTSSRDLRLAALQKRLDSSDQIESKSITEFNSVLKNKNGESSSLHATDSTADDLGMVIADEKWEKFKRNSARPSISLQVRPEDSSLDKIQDTSVKKNILPLKDTITISIVTMNLFEKTSLMNNPDVHVLYIEYSFLGMRGADMETVSLSKPKNKSEPMVYNFTRYFQVDEEYHSSQRNMLIAMLSGKTSPKISFVVVSEPLPEDMNTKECVEVGHADLNIREYALGDGLRDVSLIIMNPVQSEQLGILKLTIDGVEIIRDCMMVQKLV